MVSSKSVIVPNVTFKFLIHFEFIFVYGITEGFSFSLSHAAVQFSQDHLLKKMSFSPLYILVSSQVTIGIWISLWAFCPDPSIYISMFVPVLYCLDYCSFVVQSMNFPGGTAVKNLTDNARNIRGTVSIPESTRSSGGNGNPFQYSCLENPKHRGVWQATVHGVAKSQTQLSK